MSLTALAFWVLYAGGLIGAVCYPLIGVLLYIVVYHVNPETQWWGHSFESIGLRTSFTVAAATLIGIVIRRPRLSPAEAQFPPTIVLALALLALAFLSQFWGLGDNEYGPRQLEKYTKILIFVLMLIRCVHTPQAYLAIMYAWVLGVTYIGYQAWGGQGLSFSGRLSGGVGGPDFDGSSGLAVHLTASLPIVLAAVVATRLWKVRAFLLFTAALTVNTIIMTRTRNALVGFAVMGAYAVAHLPTGYRLRGFLALGLTCLGALHLADARWWERMETITNYQQDVSAQGRLEFWGAAVRMVRDHPLGIGLGNFYGTVSEYVPALETIRSAHSSYMTCLAELGYLGLVVYLSILFLALADLRFVRIRSAAPDLTCAAPNSRTETLRSLRWHAFGLACGIVGYAACGAFTTRLWTEGSWMLIAFAAALANVAYRYRYESADAAVPLAAVPAPPPTSDKWVAQPS